MNPASPAARRFGRVYACVAGTLDTATGLLLVASPLTVLHWMWIHVAPSDTIWLRFIGAFVAGVGMLYLIPFVAGDPARFEHRLVSAIESTTIARSCVGLFVVGAVSTGALTGAWLSVGVTDLVLAALQIAMLRAGVFNHAS